MRRPSLFWRGLMRVERHLPVTSLAVGGTPAEPRRLTTGQRIGVSLLVVLPALTSVLRLRRRDVSDIWATWQPMFLDLLVVCAAAAIVAAVVAGIVAWRRAERDAHA